MLQWFDSFELDLFTYENISDDKWNLKSERYQSFHFLEIIS